jgi:hypothetical protein
MSNVRAAAGAVRRGANQEALVLLWNELESARLAGDRSALETIGRIAGHIAEEGDEAERREAERLVDAVRAAEEEDGSMPATGRIEAELSPIGERVEQTLEEEAGDRRSTGLQLGPFVWFLILLAIVVLNLLGQLRD